MGISIEQLLTKVNDLLQTGERLKFRQGQVLFYQGHHPTGLYILCHGEVLFSPANRAEPHKQTPRLLGAQPLLEGSEHPATCTAASDVDVTFVSRGQIQRLIGK